MQLTDLKIGILFVLALSSVGVYGVALAGWASNSKYSLLGGLALRGADDLATNCRWRSRSSLRC